MVGGLVGGWAFTQVFAGPQPEPPRSLYAAATGLGAFVVARLVSDIYGLVKLGANAGKRSSS